MEVIHLSCLLWLQKACKHKCPLEIPLLKQQIYETVAFSCGCDPHEEGTISRQALFYLPILESQSPSMPADWRVSAAPGLCAFSQCPPACVDDAPIGL